MLREEESGDNTSSTSDSQHEPSDFPHPAPDLPQLQYPLGVPLPACFFGTTIDADSNNISNETAGCRL